MKTKISRFITAILLFSVGTSIVIAQGTKAYFKKDGVTVFESAISDIDSIVFKQVDINEFNVFPNAEIVEVEYMGETVYCHYADGYYIMEGDIIIKCDIDNSSPLRAAEQKGITRWKDGKVYYIMNDNSAVKGSINATISQYHDHTNLKFIRIQTNEAKEYITKYLKSGRIEFVDSDKNESYVGMINPTSQNVWLDVKAPSVIHEIGHAIGLAHEHSRSDRDNFIVVNYNNIPNSIRHNFDKCNIATHSSSFDYGSIMMYPPKIDDAINPDIPVITKKDGSAFTEYQRDRLTFNDLDVLKQMYPNLQIVEPDIMIYKQNMQSAANSRELRGELIYEGKPSVPTQYGIRITKMRDGRYIEQLGTKIGNNSGAFSCLFTNLEPNVEHRAKAFAIQNGNYVWSQNEVSFTNFCPIISISNINPTSATATVEIDLKKVAENTGSTPTEVGCCISTDINFSPGTWFNVTTTINNMSQSTYTLDITTLKPKTTYYIYGWVKVGNSYIDGNKTNFTTYDDLCTGDYSIINGVKWATRNVGAPHTFAANPTDYGEYYQWNKGTTDFLHWYDYWNSVYAKSDTWLPANDPSPSGWRVPTYDEIDKLLDTSKVTNEWTIINGVNGRKFTDKSTGSCLFLPGSGNRGDLSDGTLGFIGFGYYWSSTQRDSSLAYYLGFADNVAYWSDLGGRSYGFSVRSVAD